MIKIINSFTFYDWKTTIYIIAGLACFMWISMGKDYVV